MGNCCPSEQTVTPPAPRPGIVVNLTATHDTDRGAVTLQWDQPLSNGDRVTGYDIRFKPVSADHYEIRTVDRHHLTVTLKPEDGVTPLSRCNFDVRAKIHEVAGQWVGLIQYVEWVCRLPGCFNSRIHTSQRDVYEFCCRDHAKEFGMEYCLFPECKQRKSGASHYCSNLHLRMARIRTLSTLLEINGQNEEFKGLCSQFRRDWAKGKCPFIQAVLKVVNPAVEAQFENYAQQLPRKHRRVEQYYHGTTLACDILRYLLVCRGSAPTHGIQHCGVCGIVRNGFDERQISNRWQRFGPGFYLAPKSSKAADYCQDNNGCYAMLLCDVAPGKKYQLRRNNTGLTAPPDNCHSVYGRCKFLGTFGDLNYDEIVLYHAGAICPRYVFIFRKD